MIGFIKTLGKLELMVLEGPLNIIASYAPLIKVPNGEIKVFMELVLTSYCA